MPFEDTVTHDQRRQMSAEAAYLRAERRGFAGGDPVRDWCEAEAEVEARLRQMEYARYAARLEEVLDRAGKKVASVRRKAASLSVDARAGWQKDVEKLAALRNALKPKLAELREQGERAGQKLREQAERIRSEIAELLRVLDAKGKH